MSEDSLVPEDFDLDAARHARSTTPPEQRTRCPVCHQTDVRPKADRDDPVGRERDNPERYHCRACGTHFDDPLTPDDPDYPEIDATGAPIDGGLSS